jgi:hypothetical protein
MNGPRLRLTGCLKCARPIADLISLGSMRAASCQLESAHVRSPRGRKSASFFGTPFDQEIALPLKETSMAHRGMRPCVS